MTATSTTSPYGLDELVQGDEVEVTVGDVAHGGHCVARIGGAHGRVVFVRHALPGERVMVEITEVHPGGYLRGDAVQILQASPDRVQPPCPYARPGACGGCDLQHVAVGAQLEWKATVVLGQGDFDSAGENRWEAVRDDTLCWPYGLALADGGSRDGAGGLLAVADSGNNRVMLWDLP